MKDDVLRTLSPSARRAIAALANVPGDAVQFHNRIMIQHAALMIAAELVDREIRSAPEAPDVQAKVLVHRGLLTTCTGYELTMGLLRDLYPDEIAAKNLSKPVGDALPPSIEKRVRPLDLD